MNAALLSGLKVDIESLGIKLEELGYERKEVKDQLEGEYRTFSQKGDFRCICCDERVDLMLPIHKNFHFRHFNKENCSYSENHATYTRQKESLEDKPKHRAGKAILRTYLEGTCKTNDIKLTDGYHFKSMLSYVPDFILEFPNGQRWAIDYLTGLKNDRKYANSLNKRRNTYIQHHFTPIFLFDSYWLAYKSEINYVSLVDGELLCVSKTNHDDLWTDFIKGLEPNLKNALLSDRSFDLQVKSMAYFSPHEREINIIRFLQENDNPKKTRTMYKPIKIPLEQALEINHEQSDFTYTSKNEDEYREEFKRQLVLIYQNLENLRAQQERERLKKEEGELKQREFFRFQGEEWKQRATKKNRDYDDSSLGVPFTGRSQRQMDADLKRDKESLHRKNSSGEPYWYGPMVKHMSKYFGIENEIEQENGRTIFTQTPLNEKGSVRISSDTNTPLETNNELTSSLPSWKIDEILNHYVNGEAYFSGESRQWKEIVLNSFELIYTNKVSVPQLRQKIKDSGIQFKQSEEIMSYPIKEYLQYIGKKVKKGINLENR